jgi:hypothetical protein
MTVMQRARRSQPPGLAGVVALLFVVVVATIAGTTWWVGRYVDADPLIPTRRREDEQRALDRKLARLDDPGRASPRARPGEGPLEPAPYAEEDADREVRITERELNGLVARDDAVARRVAIDLSDDLVSVTMLVPFDRDFPLLGGKTLRIATGLELAYAADRPVVAIRGISLGGIPLPRAWWGDIKGKNLVEEFGTPGGFWDQFARGVDGIRVRDGELWIALRE